MAAGQAHATSSSSHGDKWDALQGFRDAVQEISLSWDIAGVSSIFSPAQGLAQGLTSFDISIYCLPIQ